MDRGLPPELSLALIARKHMSAPCAEAPCAADSRRLATTNCLQSLGAIPSCADTIIINWVFQHGCGFAHRAHGFASNPPVSIHNCLQSLLIAFVTTPPSRLSRRTACDAHRSTGCSSLST